MKTIRIPLATLVAVAAVTAMLGCSGGDRPSKPQSPQPQGFKTVTFSNGKVEFGVPKEYVQSAEPDGTIALKPSDDAGITLRFNLHYLEGADLPADVGTQFVRKQAKDKGLKVMEVAEKVLLTEGGTRKEGERQFDMTFWQIGFQNAVVVMSAEIDQARKSDEAVIGCMNAVPEIIKSMRKP